MFTLASKGSELIRSRREESGGEMRCVSNRVYQLVLIENVHPLSVGEPCLWCSTVMSIERLDMELYGNESTATAPTKLRQWDKRNSDQNQRSPKITPKITKPLLLQCHLEYSASLLSTLSLQGPLLLSYFQLEGPQKPSYSEGQGGFVGTKKASKKHTILGGQGSFPQGSLWKTPENTKKTLEKTRKKIKKTLENL